MPTVGGQTGLNLAVELAEGGILEKYGVELIGASLRAIKVAEDRLWFKDAIRKVGLDVPASALVNNVQDGLKLADQLGYPVVIRPSFTLGGTGGSIAYNREEFSEAIAHALDSSPVHEALVEESVLGWKEYELEVMRDYRDNFVVICSIENFDPMGVHTGDSITVAPAQTLTDKEYQRMRDAAAAIIREVGVETGGSNIQFAIDPATGRMIVIEMNPRVSRSSALASKATGFPIAKIAALLAVGMTLDEIPNDITQENSVVLRAHDRLRRGENSEMAVREICRRGFDARHADEIRRRSDGHRAHIQGSVAKGYSFARAEFAVARSCRYACFAVARKNRHAAPRPHSLAFRRPGTRNFREGSNRTDQDRSVVHRADAGNHRDQSQARVGHSGDGPGRFAARRQNASAQATSSLRKCGRRLPRPCGIAATKAHICPVFKRVDTCAAEFESFTPYMYSTYEDEDESEPTDRPKIAILGSGPNRIGQGIEFDYCCCHASFALREDGYETIMINCNPETVSTDYDTSDRLYFEPLTLEDVLSVVDREKPQGVIVQFGGQTPLNLALELKRNGVPIIGTAPESIDLAEDRRRFGRLA